MQATCNNYHKAVWSHWSKCSRRTHALIFGPVLAYAYTVPDEVFGTQRSWMHPPMDKRITGRRSVLSSWARSTINFPSKWTTRATSGTKFSWMVVATFFQYCCLARRRTVQNHGANVLDTRLCCFSNDHYCLWFVTLLRSSKAVWSGVKLFLWPLFTGIFVLVVWKLGPGTGSESSCSFADEVLLYCCFQDHFFFQRSNFLLCFLGTLLKDILLLLLFLNFLKKDIVSRWSQRSMTHFLTLSHEESFVLCNSH